MAGCRSPEHRAQGKPHSKWTTILWTDNRIIDRGKWKNNERQIKVVWGPRKASVIMRTLLTKQKNFFKKALNHYVT